MKTLKPLTTHEKINQVATYVIGGILAVAFLSGVIIAVYHILTTGIPHTTI